MLSQAKDKFYDTFLREPTKENFRKFLHENCGEMDEVDFKEQWIEKGHLAKTILAMANSRGGVIIVGIREEENGSIVPRGLDAFKDKAKISNEITKYISSDVDYQILNFEYNASEYEAMKDKKFQMLVVHDTPDRLPFFSLNETTGLEKDVIYVRRGTKCVKATAEEIERIIENKIKTIFKESSNLSLEQHLGHLKTLYGELPQKIKVLVRKGELSPGLAAFGRMVANLSVGIYDTPDEYEERDNPNYPEESYEAFVLRMIRAKKLKIEKVLDLK